MEIIYTDPELPKLHPATDHAAGYDLRSTIDCVIPSKSSCRIPTGIKIHMGELEQGLLPCAVIMPRSSLGCRGIRPWNTPGLIDADYQGEIQVCLYNDSHETFRVNKGDRIAQLVFMVALHPTLKEVSVFSEYTQRADGGFGSTGTK